MLDHNTISAKRWIDKNLRTGFLICTPNFQPFKKSHFKEIQKHQYLLLSDPNFENESIGMLKRQDSFFWSYNIRYTGQSISDFYQIDNNNKKIPKII